MINLLIGILIGFNLGVLFAPGALRILLEDARQAREKRAR